MNVNSWLIFFFYLLFLGVKIWYWWCWFEEVMYVYLRCKSIRIGIYCSLIINFYVIGYEWVKYINNNYLLKYKVLIKIRDFNLW